MPPPPPTHPAGSSDQPAGSIAWHVEHSTGPADDFHRRNPDADPDRIDQHRLWVHTTPTPALILGSTQPDELVRHDRARTDGIEVGRRRSGGGLVFLDPATDCWIDAIVPTGSPLWDDDVGRAFHWLGAAWVDVLDDALGASGPALLHRGGPRTGAAIGATPGPERSGPRRPAKPVWCFADLGHGEVTIGGAKVVGLSQRRTRHSARLQALVLGRWPGRSLLPYIDLEVARAITDPSVVTLDPGDVRAGPPPGIRLPSPATLATAFIDRVTR